MSSGRSWTGSAFFDRLSARTTMRSAETYSTTPGRLATTTAPESRATTCSMPVPTRGRLRLQERHGLPLHVGAHERAVGVVVLEERDEGGRHRHQLLGRHVHEVDLFGRHHPEVAALAAPTSAPA